jgi:hypothetical protein
MLRRGSGLRWKLELGKERRAQGLQQLEGGQILWTGSVIQDCPVFTLFTVGFQVELRQVLGVFRLCLLYRNKDCANEG